MKNKNHQIRKMTATALFAALVFVATAFIHIAIPSANGAYVNLGDAVILLAAIGIDPFAGALAGILGAAFADLYVGAAYYIPFTIAAKVLIAMVGGGLFRAFKGRYKYLAIFIGELTMVPVYGLAYFLAGGWPLVAISTPFDLIQAGISIVVATALILLFRRTKITPIHED